MCIRRSATHYFKLCSLFVTLQPTTEQKQEEVPAATPEGDQVDAKAEKKEGGEAAPEAAPEAGEAAPEAPAEQA